MLDALYIAAVGLEAQQQQLSSAANNFANMSTTAYKRQSVDFSAILSRMDAGVATDSISPTATASASMTRFDLTPGTVHTTGRPLDLAIQGAGFIEVELPDDKIGFSRGGALQINSDGGLSLPSGQALKVDIRVPNGATNVQILPDGSVTAFLQNQTTARVLGQIDLVTFANPDVLTYSGDGIFTLPDQSSSEPARTVAGTDGTQPFAPQSLESSNVDMTNETIAMTLIQRVYELNSRVAQIADELMGMSNNMRHE